MRIILSAVLVAGLLSCSHTEEKASETETILVPAEVGDSKLPEEMTALYLQTMLTRNPAKKSIKFNGEGKIVLERKVVSEKDPEIKLNLVCEAKIKIQLSGDIKPLVNSTTKTLLKIDPNFWKSNESFYLKNEFTTIKGGDVGIVKSGKIQDLADEYTSMHIFKKKNEAAFVSARGYGIGGTTFGDQAKGVTKFKISLAKDWDANGNPVCIRVFKNGFVIK